MVRAIHVPINYKEKETGFQLLYSDANSGRISKKEKQVANYMVYVLPRVQQNREGSSYNNCNIEIKNYIRSLFFMVRTPSYVKTLWLIGSSPGSGSGV